MSALTDWFDKQKTVRRQCDYVLTSHVTIPAITDADVIREATVLEDLAQLTADLDDPRDAAMTLFGEAREG